MIKWLEKTNVFFIHLQMYDFILIKKTISKKKNTEALNFHNFKKVRQQKYNMWRGIKKWLDKTFVYFSHSYLTLLLTIFQVLQTL